MEEIIIDYQKLKAKEKARIEQKMYVIYRGKFDTFFSAAQYSESISWLEKAKNHQRYNTDLLENKQKFLMKGIKTYFVEFLNTGNSVLVKKGCSLFEELEFLGVNSILNDKIYKEVFALKKSIEQNNLITKVNLQLPLAMREAKGKPITVQFDDLIASVDYINFPTNNIGFEANGAVMKQYDKEGQITSTSWTIELNKYINCEQLIKVDSGYYISILDEIVCSIVNAVVNNYRVVSEEYWIKNIYPFMITNKVITYLAEGITFREIPFLDNGTYKMGFTDEKLEFPTTIRAESLQLYDLLLLDSQSYLLSGNFRESILSLNSAFENYIYTVVCPLIVERSAGELNEYFYYKTPAYHEFHFKDYMDEESYQSALKQGLIKEEGISTFKIIKILYEYCEELASLMSKKRMNKLINNIRKNRNDFIHGNKNIISTSYKEVFRQIEDLKQFKKIISRLIDMRYGN